MKPRYDPIKLEVFKNLFASVAEEMGVALCRTGHSPNIKERRDYSCAVFDGGCAMVAQAAHIPVHLGSMPLAVKGAMEGRRVRRGDTVVLNDPYRGGTHLPDLTLVSPVFADESPAPLFFVANRAHHADVGGMAPGSMAVTTEIFQEGIRIPPVTLVDGGNLNRDVFDLLLANVRTPEEREGDLEAQLAANETGRRRLLEVVARAGAEEARQYMDALKAYAERMTREAIRRIPDGRYTCEDYLDDDGIGAEPIRIAVAVTVTGDQAVIDFTGTSPQVAGSVNAVYAVTLSAVFYVFRCLVDFDIPSNAGCMVPLTVIAPAGTVVNAVPPAAVAGGNVETSQRIVDVLLRALAKALPDRIPAASAGTMSNLIIGGPDPERGRNFAYYETIAGGMGARPTRDGMDAVQTHMTNTRNTPIEALEHAYPLRVLRYEIRRGSGGKGRYRGGDGIRRDIGLLTDAAVGLLSDRRRFRPYGLRGGEAGQAGESILVTPNGERPLGSKFHIQARAGDVISIRTPGGGGYGRTTEGNR
ncbi:MAG: hydantoinase B/oxoprolinase family protein [Candidatus Methylomirabilales bacterium]